MAEENTTILERDLPKGQSKIFNTSVRGWIALILAAALSAALAMILIAPFRGVTIPEGVSTPLVTLFISGFTAAVTHYFQQGSKEGQR